MAELIAGGEKTRLVLNGDGALVGRHSDDGSFKPDIDLGGLEGGRTVSRRHAHIFRRDGQWYLKVESTTTNATTVGGRALSTGQEAALQDGDEILLGKVPLVFHAGIEAPPPNPDATMIRAVESSAELRAEGQTYPLAAPGGRQLALGRHSDDRTYHPDIDLGDLKAGKTVSRRHGLLYCRGDQWFLKVEAAVTNPTILNGTTLALGQEVVLDDTNTLQLGKVVVTFHQLRKIPTVGQEQIELVVDPMQMATEVGREVRATVTVVNHTGHVDWFRIEVEGIPADWYQIFLPDGTVGQPAQVRLFHTPAHTATPSPDAVAQLKLYLRPPKDCQSWAGVHQFVVSATTQGEPQARQATSCQVTVGRFESLEIGIQPEKIARPSGEFKVDVHNAGNDLVNATVETAGDALLYQLDRQQLALSNCAKDQLTLKVRVKRRHWLGAEKDYTFSVTMKGGTLKEDVLGYVTCPPRIPYWLQMGFSRIQPLLLPLLTIAAIVVLALVFLRPPNIQSFKADPASVIVGTPVALSWTVAGAKSVSIDPSSGNEQLTADNGKLPINPTATTRYTLTARNLVGISSSQAVNVNVLPAPKVPQIVSFTVSADHLPKEGQAVTIDWKTDGATSVTIDPADEIKSPQPSGEATVHPTQNNTVYKLTATNDAGSVTATKTIVIDPPQVLSFTASSPSVDQGGADQLTWTAQNFTKLTIKASAGEVEPGKQEVDVTSSSSETVHPLQDTEYTITATNAGGTDTKNVKITASPMQIAFFKADPGAIAKGEQAQLSWNVTGATTITIQPGIGAVSAGQSSALIKPDKTTTYTLTATSPAGKKGTATATITVGLGAVKIDFITAAPTSITKGETATLTFSVQNAKHITIQGSDGTVVKDVAVTDPTLQGSVTVSPTTTTTYTLTATNDSGSDAQPATVSVQNPTPTPAPTPSPPAAKPTPKPGG
ncbi:MAG TPA: FHA domain-containing protein [Chloroflexota bacterium]|nr:FHA domain-containing protein [Chloroflexota bacterium]